MTQIGDDNIDWDNHWTKVQLDVIPSETKILNANVFEWVLDSLPKTPFTVLEIGCGPGIYAHAWEAIGGIYYGLDFSQEAINIAKQRHPKCQLIHAVNHEVKLFNRNFDVIFTNAHLQHVSNANKYYLFKQLYDVLVKSGLLITMNEKHDADTATSLSRDKYINFIESSGFQLERYVNRYPRGDPTNGFAFRKV